MIDQDFNVLVQEARKAFELDKYDEVIELYLKAKNIKKDCLQKDDFRKLAFCLIENNKFKEAEIILDEWSKIDFESPILYSMQGHIFRETSRLEEAAVVYRKSVKIKERPSGYCILGVVQRDLGKIEEARKCFEKALLIDPNYDEAYQNLKILKQMKDS